MESRRKLRLVAKQSATLAVKGIIKFNHLDDMSLRALVRHGCIGNVEDELLTNDDVLGEALSIMMSQN